MRPVSSALRSPWLLWCLALHLLLGGYYVAILPLWGAVPDEPLHYSRIKYQAEIGGFPLITDPRSFGEPLWVYCFTADPVGTSQHGPLYYSLAVPLYDATRGLTVQAQLYVLRLYSLFWGALCLPFAWAVLRRCFPENDTVCGLGLLAVTLSPHRLMLSAVVYNDIACVTTVFAALYLALRAAQLTGTRMLESAGENGSDPNSFRLSKGGAWAWFWAGVGLGLAFLAKRVALVALPAECFLLWATIRGGGWNWRRFLGSLSPFLAGFALLGGWWQARDLWIYGELFPTEPAIPHLSWGFLWANATTDQIQWMAAYAVRGFWLSIWSQVGWLPFDGPGWWPLVTRIIYGGLLLLTALTFVGFAWGWRGNWRDLHAAEGLSPRRLGVTFFLLLLGMIYGALHWVMLGSFHNNEETGKHGQAIFVGIVVLWFLAARQLFGKRGAVWGAGALVALLLAFNLGSLVWLQTNLIPRFAPATPALALQRVGDLPSGRAPGIWHRYLVPGVVQMGAPVARPATALEPATRANRAKLH